MKRFTQYFTEAHGKNDACFKIFQNTLFGSTFEKKEKDTPKEKEINKLLLKFVAGDFDGKSKDKVVKAFKQLKKCTSHFPKELTPEKNILLRGSFMKAKKLRENSIKASVDKKGGITGTMKWKASAEIQSWTTRRDAAEKFATTFGFAKDDTVGIIIKVKFTKKELLFSSKFLENFKVWNDVIEGEHEIIRISGKEIKVEFELMDTVFELRQMIGSRFTLAGYIKLMDGMGISPWAYVIQTEDKKLLVGLSQLIRDFDTETKKLSQGKYGLLNVGMLNKVKKLKGAFKITEKGPGSK